LDPLSYFQSPDARIISPALQISINP